MKTLVLLLAAGVAVALALPAIAASPPAETVARLKGQVATLQAKARRLESANRQLARAEALSRRRVLALARHAAAAGTCPVTAPNGSEPPGSTFGSEFHGNGTLWVGVWPANVVVSPPAADGTVEEKFGWWRGAAGALRIEGRRLDGPSPPLGARIPDGYGDSGFQSTSLAFPSAGCWEVTGHLGGTSLTFVTLVVAA